MKKFLAFVFTIILATSVCTSPVSATQFSSPSITDQTSETGDLTPSPPYLNPTTRGADIPGNVKDLSNSDYSFDGLVFGNKSVYTNYLFTGKYTYYISIQNYSNSSSAMKYQVINASSNNEIKASGTVNVGQKVNLTVGGLSLTSKIYIKFTGTSSDSSKWTEVYGTIS